MRRRGSIDSITSRRLCRWHAAVWLLVCSVVTLASLNSALAAIPAGLPCSDCHTMHNSQDGAFVVSEGPQEALLNNTCIGCHSGQNSGGETPYVFNASTAPDYGLTGTETGTNTLAGGNFYWVAQAGGDSVGHNVSGLVLADPTLTVPPGFGSGLAAADGTLVGNGGGWQAGTQATCAGVYGCHGSHDQTSAVQAIHGGHHSLSSGAVVPGGSPTAANSYRMLVGIAGFEDPDWEYQPTSTAHNQYKGAARSDDSNSGSTDTISYLCAQCHGTFHSGATTDGVSDDVGLFESPWIRHPIDFDMGGATGSEYQSYPAHGTIGAYSVITPVASTSIATVRTTVTTTSADGTAIVTCISCHRAHGSPYYKSMRWDYANTPDPGGSIVNYCTNCHTSKS